MIIKKSNLKLIPSDHKILHTVPAPYKFENNDAVMFSNVLYERMKELGGIGLSANQVGVCSSVFVMGIGDIRMDVFNPEILNYSKETVMMDEGCLSFPGIFLQVRRPESVEVKYYNNTNQEITTTLTGLTARVFQHEFDHMLGVTFKSKVSVMKWEMAVKKYNKKNKQIVRKHVANIKKQLRGKK